MNDKATAPVEFGNYITSGSSGGYFIPPALADRLVAKVSEASDVLGLSRAADEAARFHRQIVPLGWIDRLLALFGLISVDAHLESMVRVIMVKNDKIAEVRRSVAPESSGWTGRDWGEA